MMKKAGVVVAAVAVLAVGGWAGAAWYTGKRVEETVKQTIADAMAAGNVHARIEIASYDRGVFTSTARYRITSLASSGLPEGLLLVVDSTVRHGPFPTDRLVKGRLAPVLATTNSSLSRTEGLGTQLATVDAGATFRERSVIHYDRNVDFQIDTPALSMAQDGSTIEVAGGSFTGSGAADLSRLDLQGQLESFRVSSAAGQEMVMEARNMTVSGNNRAGRFGLQVGEAVMKFGSISMSAPTPAGPFSLNATDVSIGSKVTEDERFIHGGVDYDFSKLTLNGTDLGTVRASLYARQLDGAATATVLKQYQALMAEAEVPIDGTMDDALLEKMLAEMREPLNALLAGLPSFGLDTLSWRTPAGESSLKVGVTLHPRQAPAGATPEGQPARPGVGLEKASLDLVISQPAVTDVITRFSATTPEGKQASEEERRQQAEIVTAILLMSVANSGLAVEKGDNIESHVNYDGKVLTVNGEEQPPEVLMELLSIMPGAGLEPDEE